MMDERPRPQVLIVGAGIGGLMAGALLEKIGVPYTIFERAVKVKPLGALMGFNANILSVFEQLGLLERVLAISFPCLTANIFKQNMERIASLAINYKEITGYDSILFPRPELYDILLSCVPPEKILMQKRVLKISEKPESITIHCSDNVSYTGQILIGADGAYSSVRQNMYRIMKEKELETGEALLPESDTQDLAMSYICMVGTTRPQDPAKYPGLKDPWANLAQIIGDGTPYSWTTITVPGNRICWSVVQQIPDQAVSSRMRFQNSTWAADANEEMLQEIGGFSNGLGGLMKDLVEETPVEVVSKVMLEEKLFETWYHGRSVLIGDACHKMLPTAGQGAMNAIQDAVVLANCLYDLQDLSLESLEAAFKDYQTQRYPFAKKQFEISKVNAKVTSGQTRMERVVRHIVFNFIPKWVQTRNFATGAAYRPQIGFLPYVENRGKGPVLPQVVSKRYQKEQEEWRRRQKNQDVVTAL